MPELSQCFASFVTHSSALLSFVENAQQQNIHTCMVSALGTFSPDAPAPREPCGALSEELWNASSAQIETLLRTTNDTAPRGSLDGKIFADVNCANMTDKELGHALQVASRSPRWIAPNFVECVVRRESQRESYALWVALDTARAHPGERWAFLEGIHATDERTLSRISQVIDPGANRAARPNQERGR